MIHMMGQPTRNPILHQVHDASQIAEVRRKATHLAVRADFSPTRAGRVAIVATEAATNQIKHTKGGGYVLLQLLHEEETVGVEILAIDRGRGIRNIAEALRDGFSTAGSTGTGLGAMSRLSDVFDIFSERDKGTVLVSRIWQKELLRTQNHPFEVSAFSVPLPGEPVSGDAWAVAQHEHFGSFMMADGLGHGLYASNAAKEAIDAFSKHSSETPAQLLRRAHEALSTTRGAAVSVARIDLQTGELIYAGVGNVSGLVVSPRSSAETAGHLPLLVEPKISHMVNYDGIVGENMRKTREFRHSFSAGSIFILHSDGISSRWSIAEHLGLIKRHPSIIAGVIFRDAYKSRDDAAVLVARLKKTKKE